MRSLCSLGWSQLWIFLPQASECWDYRCAPRSQACFVEQKRIASHIEAHTTSVLKYPLLPKSRPAGKASFRLSSSAGCVRGVSRLGCDPAEGTYCISLFLTPNTQCAFNFCFPIGRTLPPLPSNMILSTTTPKCCLFNLVLLSSLSMVV